ncbi:ABC transporter ATP-binding protein [Promethearchaeum syntrophicum]|uniref:ABC transporter ATP-binding protein n=1 Tax=Promethearchaeum syntrophicum TaxID=2594042 RepID=A0A5B9D5T7_9ARCH|nr:ABC transporter ATP-binding protein [Candidatus Prometheoarchaeum syntrophicum]
MSKNTENAEVYLRFKNVTKKFGNITAVSNVNLDIHKGEIVGFLGPNGAGKSTTMKMLAYLLRPTEGEIFIRGNGKLEKLTSKNKDYLLDNIGFLIENPFFYGNMTPREILSYFGELKGYPRSKIKQRVEDVVAMVHMMDWIDVKIGKFSKGMRQKIGVISALVHDPDIIVLDEPHTGLDPTARKMVRELILKLSDMGKTIFLSSHLLYEVSEVADRVAMINFGEIIACDTLEKLEEMAKKSEIQMELLEIPEAGIEDTIKNLDQIIGQHTGLDNKKDYIRFNPDTEIFEILFNGDPKNQLDIFKALFAAGIDVIEFSVPKAGLLEDLYLDFMDESENGESSKARTKEHYQKNAGDIKV